MPAREDRERIVGLGLGGDDTTAIDAAAENAVVARLERSLDDFTLVSEELGEKRFGGGDGPCVVLDPIDGSLNREALAPALLGLARGRRRALDGRRRLRLRLRLRLR